MLRNGDNNDDVKEGGLHPTTPQMKVTCKLVERLCSPSCDWQRAEEGEGNINNDGDNEHINGCVRGLRWADTGDGRW